MSSCQDSRPSKNTLSMVFPHGAQSRQYEHPFDFMYACIRAGDGSSSLFSISWMREGVMIWLSYIIQLYLVLDQSMFRSSCRRKRSTRHIDSSYSSLQESFSEVS